MEGRSPARKTRASTADLLTWPEDQQLEPEAPRPGIRHHQPAPAISPVMFGGAMSAEEAESVLRRKPCSGPKLKEMSGSGIFAAESENGASESGSAFSTPNNKTSVRIYQQATSSVSQISFSADDSVSPKKPTSLAEVAKQRELSGTLASEAESKMKKQLSDAKCKELSGHDIFGPPPEVRPKPLGARNLELRGNIELGEPMSPDTHSSADVSDLAGGSSNNVSGKEPVIKTAKKIHDQKVAELTGNDIFKGDDTPGSTEKSLSVAKLREISGSDIFADGKVESRDYFGGVRKPPGGESSIALV